VSIHRRVAPVLLAGALAACTGAPRGAGQGTGSDTNVATRTIDAVLAGHRDALLALPGVVGTAIGLCDGERCIKVLVADSGLAAQGKIPSRLEGYRVIVEVTGTIRPR
jgi:hypothetical protein